MKLVGCSMLVAGPVMVIRGQQGRAELRSELAKQKIKFPARADLPEDLVRFAGRRVDTGRRARAYSDLIKSNLDVITGGRAYAELTREVSESDKKDEKLVKLRETAFAGEILRASLMSAYQAGHITTLVIGLGALFTGLGAALLAVARALRT